MVFLNCYFFVTPSCQPFKLSFDLKVSSFGKRQFYPLEVVTAPVLQFYKLSINSS